MMQSSIYVYLVLHALTTLGSILALVIRFEHRITRLETKVEHLEKRFK